MSSEVVVYLERLVARLQELLGVGLVGVYAGGSYALGGYEPGRSDLDVAAVCRGPLGVEAKTRIVEALRHESLRCPARGLELVLYPESTVLAPTAAAGYELNLNTGRGMPFHVSFAPGGEEVHWFTIDRAILREHGVVLFGSPAGDVFAPISRELVLRALSESIEWHATSRDARADDAVLNACRAWRYATDGTWSSKQEAGEWARRRTDDPGLIEAAIAARSDGRDLDREHVHAFLRGVGRVVESSPSTIPPVSRS
jgi:hypothetical protein